MASLDDLLNKQREEALKPDAFKEKPRFSVDERFYQLSKDQNGCAKVLIRFMPSLNTVGDQLNTYVTQQYHNVNWNKNPLDEKSERKYFAGVCPKTKDPKAPCPICEWGFEQGGKIDKVTGPEAKTDPQQLLRTKYYKEFVSKDKHICNIMVIKDDINPENNGKVFLFELKPSIYKMFAAEAEKVQDQLDTYTTDEEKRQRNIPTNLQGFNPFDLEIGKDLWLVYKSKKYTDGDVKNYWGHSRWDDIYTDKSGGTKDSHMDMLQMGYNLDEFMDDKVIPEMDFLQTKLTELTFGAYKKPSDKEEAQQEAPVNSAEQVVQNIVQTPEVSNTPVSNTVDAIAAITGNGVQEPVIETVQEEAPKQEEKPAQQSSSEPSIDDIIAQIQAGS